MAEVAGVCGVGRSVARSGPPCPGPAQHSVTVIRDGTHLLCDAHFDRMMRGLPAGSQIRDLVMCDAGRRVTHERAGWGEPCPYEAAGQVIVHHDGVPVPLGFCVRHSEELAQMLGPHLG